MSEQLLKYLQGELSPEERAAIEEQLAKDPALRDELSNVRATIEVLGAYKASCQAPSGYWRNFNPMLIETIHAQKEGLGVSIKWLVPSLAAAALVFLLIRPVFQENQAELTETSSESFTSALESLDPNWLYTDESQTFQITEEEINSIFKNLQYDPKVLDRDNYWQQFDASEKTELLKSLENTTIM